MSDTKQGVMKTPYHELKLAALKALDQKEKAAKQVELDQQEYEKVKYASNPFTFSSPKMVVVDNYWSKHDQELEDAIFNASYDLETGPMEGTIGAIEASTEPMWKTQSVTTTSWTDNQIVSEMEKKGLIKKVLGSPVKVSLDYQTNYEYKMDTSTWQATVPVGIKPQEKFTTANEAINHYYAAANPSSYTPPAPTIWKMKSARQMVELLQEWSRQFNYHVCLGGGVLNKGESKKDLDLYFLPFNEKGRKPAELLKALQIKLKAPLEKFGSDYPEQMVPYIFKGKLMFEGKKRIDFFMMGTLEEAKMLEKDDSFLMGPEQWHPVEVSIDPANIIHFKKAPK